MAQLGITYLLRFFPFRCFRPATGVMNEKGNLEDVSELHCDTKRLHSPNSFQFSVLKASEPAETGCKVVTVAGQSAACPNLLTGNLKPCKFRNVDLDSCVYTKGKKKKRQNYNEHGKKNWLGC